MDWPTQVRHACDGDMQAYAVLVRRFRDMACGYAYSLLGDFHLAEDAAQEAFLHAYRDLPTLNLKSPSMNLGKLGAWEELIQELLWAWRCRAWSNPKWRDYIMRCQKEAEQEGHPEHWWIYSLWDMVQKPPHI